MRVVVRLEPDAVVAGPVVRLLEHEADRAHHLQRLLRGRRRCSGRSETIFTVVRCARACVAGAGAPAAAAQTSVASAATPPRTAEQPDRAAAASVGGMCGGHLARHVSRVEPASARRHSSIRASPSGLSKESTQPGENRKARRAKRHPKTCVRPESSGCRVSLTKHRQTRPEREERGPVVPPPALARLFPAPSASANRAVLTQQRQHAIAEQRRRPARWSGPAASRTRRASHPPRTRSARARRPPRACPRTRRARAAARPRSSGRSADDLQVHLDLLPRPLARRVSVLVDDRDGADDDPHVVVADPPRITRPCSGFAEPPIFTSSATSPASAAIRGFQVPIISGTRSRAGSYSKPAPAASENCEPAKPERSPARSRRTISTASRIRATGARSSSPSRSSHAPATRPR